MPNVLDLKLSFKPRFHQYEARQNRKRFSVLVWHRRSGKTVFSLMELLLGAVSFRATAGRFGYVAPYYRQARMIAWDYLKRFSAEVPGVRVFEGDLMIAFPNGATVRLFGADNPDSLRGLYFDGIVLDEVADMRPQVWGEIIRPALSDREGWALFIGTPKGLNLFSELYYRALVDPEWYADMRRASETGVIPEAELDRARREMSPAQYAQEFECDFGASAGNVLIPLDLARGSAGKRLKREQFYYAPCVVGVDVARFGEDRSCILVRQGLAVLSMDVLRGVNTMELASKTLDVAMKNKADAVFVDEVGVGSGVVDRLRQLGGFNVFPVNGGAKPANERFVNLRAEMWMRTADWLREGGAIPDREDLIADLCTPTYSYNAAHRLVLESKEDMKKRGVPSPDLGDALALTFAFTVHKKDIRDAAIEHKHSMAKTDYDLFSS